MDVVIVAAHVSCLALGFYVGANRVKLWHRLFGHGAVAMTYGRGFDQDKSLCKCGSLVKNRTPVRCLVSGALACCSNGECTYSQFVAHQRGQG